VVEPRNVDVVVDGGRMRVGLWGPTTPTRRLCSLVTESPRRTSRGSRWRASYPTWVWSRETFVAVDAAPTCQRPWGNGAVRRDMAWVLDALGAGRRSWSATRWAVSSRWCCHGKRARLNDYTILLTVRGARAVATGIWGCFPAFESRRDRSHQPFLHGGGHEGPTLVEDSPDRQAARSSR